MEKETRFANIFKELVAGSGYSYRELGRLSGVNYTYISKIANAKMGIPSPEVVG